MMAAVRWAVRSMAVAGLLLVFAMPAAAEDPEQGDGQAELDQAIEAKLSAETVADLGKVIGLCETALKKGLDEENKAFAEKLLSSTLIQRAQALSRAVRAPWPNEQKALRRIVQLRALAVNDLQRALELDTEHPEAYLLLGQLHALPGGDRKKAIEALSKAIELSEENPRLRARALAARAPLQESPEQTLADFDQAVQLAPQNAAFVRDRGLFRIQHGDVAGGLADLDRSLELNPKHVDTLEARAVALGMQDDYQHALESLNRAIELDPKRASAYFHRGRVHAVMGKPKLAIDDLSKALELKPNLIAARLARAEAYRLAGDLEHAIADLDVLQEKAPDWKFVRRLRLQWMVQAGRTDEAIAELKKVIDASKEPSAELWQELGTLYLFAEDDEHALEAFSEAIRINPKSAEAYLRRADTHVRLGHHAEAVADYEKALEFEPENSGALNNLAWLLATSPRDSLRDGKRAIELAKKACEVTNYKQAHILSTLAAGYAEAGDFKTAIEWSQKAVELATGELKDGLKQELERYRQGKPWREEKPGVPVPAEATAATAAKPNAEPAGSASPSETPEGTKPDDRTDPESDSGSQPQPSESRSGAESDTAVSKAAP